MKARSNLISLWRELTAAVIALLLVSVSFGKPFGQQASDPSARLASMLSAAENEAARRVTTATVQRVTTDLSSEKMQGRGTAQAGGAIAADYLAGEFSKLKLKPLGDGGTYLQSVKFKITDVLPESSVKVGDRVLKLGEDFAVTPPYTGDRNLKALLVFVGYGLQRDFGGIDLKNKIVVLIKGPPKNENEAAWEKADSERVIITYLFRSGIAGLIITNGGTKITPYERLADYLTRRHVAPADEAGAPATFPSVVYASDAGAEKLFAGSGSTYAQAKQKVERGEPAYSVEMKRTATITVRLKNTKGTASNVVGVLEGTDPGLKEQAVVYSAHYDAFGIGADGRIYPGAADNALGVAEMLAIAEGFQGAHPRRSIIFLALTGEEYGLLGGEHWVQHPTWKIDKVAADLNFDGIGTEVYGSVKNIVGFGMEYSDLGSVLQSVVTATGGSIIPDPMPDEKTFYRSDHYAFVKRGIPALMLLGAPEGTTAALVARAKKWLLTDYHQPADTVRSDWNWEGPRMLAEIGLIMGLRIADQEAMPAWLAGSPLNRPRGTNKPLPPLQ